MNYADGMNKIAGLRKNILVARGELRRIQAEIEPEPVGDHTFISGSGRTVLSSLFGDKTQMIFIHNMGSSCSYCTMWADGYNGLYEHLADRVAFVLASPDSPEQQRKFAASRGWRFPMVSDTNSDFARVMRYTDEGGKPTPGVSALERRGKDIFRVSDTRKGPYDDFCAAWHFFDMLSGGAHGWQPKLRYRREVT